MRAKTLSPISIVTTPIKIAAAILWVGLAAPASGQVNMEQIPIPTPAPGTEAEKPAKEKSEPAPTTPEARAKILKELYGQLAGAANAESARPIAEAIERVWMFSGSDTTDLLMSRAQKAVTEKNYELAMTMLNTIVDLQPDYAEGWNRRAYVYFLQNDLEHALGDIRRTLALEPKHFKALEGMANMLRQNNNKKTALEALKKLLDIHPQAEGVKQAIEELSREVEGQGI